MRPFSLCFCFDHRQQLSLVQRKWQKRWKNCWHSKNWRKNNIIEIQIHLIFKSIVYNFSFIFAFDLLTWNENVLFFSLRFCLLSMCYFLWSVVRMEVMKGYTRHMRFSFGSLVIWYAGFHIFISSIEFRW